MSYLTNKAIVGCQSIRDLIPIQAMAYGDAVRRTLREHRQTRQARW
jgi:hypothetical protein